MKDKQHFPYNEVLRSTKVEYQKFINKNKKSLEEVQKYKEIEKTKFEKKTFWVEQILKRDKISSQKNSKKRYQSDTEDDDEFDEDVARYIPGVLNLMFQGKLENITTREQPADSSYNDMQNLEFRLILTQNHYTNPNSFHLCFQNKIKKNQR